LRYAVEVSWARLAGLVLGAGVALSQICAGQSLAELAERERERRAKRSKGAAPAYGDADLAARRGDAAAAPSPSPAASPAPEALASPPGEDEETLRKRQAAEWRIRFAEAREGVARAEAAAWRTVIDVVWVAGIPVQQEVRKFEETEELRRAKQALADLEEEYRRTGLPPGWVR
jgi:hypothetical protein